MGKNIGKQTLENWYRWNWISAGGQILMKKFENIGIGFKKVLSVSCSNKF